VVAIQSFLEDLTAGFDGEAVVWIDKYCIDQNNIEDSFVLLADESGGVQEAGDLLGGK